MISFDDVQSANQGAGHNLNNPIDDKLRLLSKLNGFTSRDVFSSDDEDVIKFMANDFSLCATTFLHLSTLDSKPTLIDASRIFRLGQYIAIMNWASTKDVLDNTERYRISNSKLIITGEKTFFDKKSEDQGFEFVVENGTDNNIPDVEFHTMLLLILESWMSSHKIR